MKNWLYPILSAGAMMTSMACGPAQIPPTLMVETGCVTASGDRLVLTDLLPAGAMDDRPGGADSPVSRPVTEAYVLVGAEKELKAQVGRQVRVSGEVSSGQLVEIRGLYPMVRVRPTADTPAERDEAASRKGGEPKVGTEYELNIDVRQMMVRAVEPTGERCK